MAIRDFSQEKYDNLIAALDDIQSDQKTKFEDAFEDYLFKAANHLGIYDTERVVEGKIDSYQKHMMDAYDTTKTDLTNIFDSVQGIDGIYGGYFEDIAEVFGSVKESIQLLTESIQNINDGGSLQALQTKLSNINKRMDQADARVAESFDKALDYEMEYLTHQSTKGMVKSGISVVGDIISFCGSVMKGDVSGQIDKIWSTCNDVMDFYSNSDVLLQVSLTALGAKMLSGKDDETIERFKRKQLQYAKEELDKEDGVSGQIKSFSDNPQDNIFYQITKGVDTVQDIYGVVDGIKNFGKDIIEGKHFWTKLDEIVNPSIPNALKGNEELIDRYTKIKRTNSVIKILKDGSSPIMDTLFKEDEDSWSDYIQGQLENYTHSGAGIKVIADEVDVLEDIHDFFTGGFGD